MKMSLSVSSHFIALATAGATLLGFAVQRATGVTIHNDEEVAYTFYFRPAGNRQQGFSQPFKVESQRSRDIPLRAADDPFDVQIKPEGGEMISSSRPARLAGVSELTLSANLADDYARVPRVSSGQLDNGTDEEPVVEFEDHTDMLELRSSAWDTSYQTNDGKAMSATIRFSWEEGTFTTALFKGRLQDVTYTQDDNTFIISGEWRGNGRGGPFIFRGGLGDSQFVGEWAFSGGDQWYPWTGKKHETE